MRYNRYRLPFFAPPDEGAGSPDAGTETEVGYAGMGDPNSVQSMSSRQAIERALDAPTPLGSTTFDDPSDNGENGNAAGASDDEVTIPGNIFETGFNLDSLPPALQEPIKAAREQLESARAQLPSNEVLQNYALKSQGFDRIVNHDGFKRFMDAHPEHFGGEGSEGIGDGSVPTPSIGSSKDPVVAGLIEQFDEDQVSALQSWIDGVVSSKVQPLHDSYYNDKAEATLNGLVEKYGEKSWKDNEAATFNLMRQHSVPAEMAFLSVLGSQLHAKEAVREQAEIAKKVRHVPIGDGSMGSAPAAPSRKTPKSIREAVLQAEAMFERGEGFNPNSYLMQAGKA